MGTSDRAFDHEIEKECLKSQWQLQDERSGHPQTLRQHPSGGFGGEEPLAVKGHPGIFQPHLT